MLPEPLSNLELREPLFLALALLAPLVYRAARGHRSSLVYSSLRLPARGPRGWRARLAALPAALLGLAVLLVALAMAGPRIPDQSSIVRREGIAIMLVVDRSGSMDARDFVAGDYTTSRLDAVKQVLGTFVAGGGGLPGRPDDLIGVIAFGTFADGICPLTLDHSNLLAILDDVEVARDRGEGQTAAGEGLALAVERLHRLRARSKVVVLLTDGVNNAGNITPIQAAELAKAAAIKVYTVGAGRTGVAPIPVRTASGRTLLRPVAVQIDERTLEAIAARTGGHYFNARDQEGLAEAYREIDSLERSKLTERRYLQYRELYGSLASAALAAIMLATVLAGTLLRRLP